MKIYSVIVFALLLCPEIRGQIVMTRTATISFHSHTILENIDAVNDKGYAVIDLKNSKLAFRVRLADFEFPRKLMQVHFNENYVESHKFPVSTFAGTYSGNVNIDTNGSYPVFVKGTINLHGVTRPVHIRATIVVNNETLTGESTFKLNPTHFGISIPFIVRDKIEKENTVKVKAEWRR